MVRHGNSLLAPLRVLRGSGRRGGRGQALRTFRVNGWTRPGAVAEDARPASSALSSSINRYLSEVVFSVPESSIGIKDMDHKLLQAILRGSAICVGAREGEAVEVDGAMDWKTHGIAAKTQDWPPWRRFRRLGAGVMKALAGERGGGAISGDGRAAGGRQVNAGCRSGRGGGWLEARRTSDRRPHDFRFGAALGWRDRSGPPECLRDVCG